MGNFASIEETIYFYTWNDSKTIREYFLSCLSEGDYKKKAHYFNFESNVGTSIDASRKLLEKYENGTKAKDTPLDHKIFNILNNRVHGDIDYQEVYEKDISNIFEAMKPTKEKIVLYRTVEEQHVPKDISTYKNNPVYNFMYIFSTALAPYKEEEQKKNFYRYEIIVPENNFVLELDQYETRNEKGEVLLPLTKYKIINIRDSDSNNGLCKGIIEVEVIEQRMHL